MPLTPGTRLGTYEIVAPLGAGGMGEVYRARDSRLGRDVALKVLPAEVASHADRLARFEREARTVAGLNHPNIVTLFSVENEGGLRFLTMELVEGQTVDRLVAPGGLPFSRVLELSIPLADALVAAHERGVVHRDLKPGNVMVTREGRVKVLDFGLAKVGGSEDPAHGRTLAATVESPISVEGQVLGTVPYMAPEQIRGEAVDARSDLFALGVMLYELATGRRPFTGATSADVGSAILRDTPGPLADVRADLPADLDRIVGRCLEKNPRERFQTALDVLNELHRLKRILERGDREAPVKPVSQDVPSVAVLPFVNRSRDEEDEYFSDGLADEMLNLLAKIRGLRVAARSSAFTYKGRQVTVAEVGKALNVAAVLEGSVRKAGNRVRISVQLVKVSDGYHLWSETYDRTLEDIFAVQDDIAQSVVKELRTALLGEEPDSKASGEVKAEVAVAAKGRGFDPEAHRLFLHGRFLVNRAGHEDVMHGVENLRRALEVNPAHALAWACLSWAETLRGITGMTLLADAITKAREAARRALALEPDLAEAHLALARIQILHDFDWKGAKASIGRAMELAPGSAEVLRTAGLLEYELGRFDAALNLCLQALEQDPLSAVSYSYVGRVYRTMERLEDAESAFGKALEISPNHTAGHALLALVYEAQGRREEALAEAMREETRWARLFALGIIHHENGRVAESDAALKELTEQFWSDSAWQIASVHAARGEADAAFQWMEKGFVQHDSGLGFIKTSPYFRWLETDPRWGPFMRKIGLSEKGTA